MYHAPLFVGTSDDRLYNPITGQLITGPLTQPVMVVQPQLPQQHLQQHLPHHHQQPRHHQRRPQSHTIQGPQGLILDPLSGQPIAHVQRVYHVADGTGTHHHTHNFAKTHNQHSQHNAQSHRPSSSPVVPNRTNTSQGQGIPMTHSNPANQLSTADLMNAVFGRRGGFIGGSVDSVVNSSVSESTGVRPHVKGRVYYDI